MRRVRIVVAVDRRNAAKEIARLEDRRDVDLEVVAGAARAAASAWARRAALVIFQVSARDDAPAAGAGALDAIKALRAESSTAHVPILVLVPEGRADLRAAGFAAGASDVCFAGERFEEALLQLAGLPIRRHARRAASLPVRILPDRAATALNLSTGGVQLRWDGDAPIPPVGRVLQLELAGLSLFASVQGGTGNLTRLRFVGLAAEERTKLETLVAALPGPDEEEPEPTPMPHDDFDDDEPSVPPRSYRPLAVRATIAALVLVAAAVALAGVREVARRPVSEPAIAEHR